MESLREVKDELRTRVKDYRKMLLQELNDVDEQRYEKKLKNEMICLLISIDNKLHENITDRMVTNSILLNP